jgi:hypothetical protein
MRWTIGERVRTVNQILCLDGERTFLESMSKVSTTRGEFVLEMLKAAFGIAESWRNFIS